MGNDKYSFSRKIEEKVSNNEDSSLCQDNAKVESAHQECIDRAYRIPIFLSTTTHLNNKQQQFLNRLIFEIENALLFPRTLPLSESYPESILTDIRRLVSSSYGMLAVNLRRFKIQTVDVNTGPPPSSTPFWVGSVYSQVEPSMAFQFGLPLLLVREEDTDANNGIWAGGIAPLNLFIVWHSETQTVDQFFNTPEWRSAFANWSAQVRNAFYIQTEPKFKYRCE
ncbi:hypothetical protein AC625_23430 [Peribacillus loiseleuriae]|uniref:Uncharacterized protein n=1 Tax=Peribacillus loiseleuriae TaxID=1679170 RepID=A0A0K9GZE6_9BACI|nr:hypothetical protein [Peribacillus loiseleuriae]KMY52104.1 hypothetical protein AC625_23430 [Peribacillus loiseleuriae]